MIVDMVNLAQDSSYDPAVSGPWPGQQTSGTQGGAGQVNLAQPARSDPSVQGAWPGDGDGDEMGEGFGQDLLLEHLRGGGTQVP